jgi:hypothetical protein
MGGKRERAAEKKVTLVRCRRGHAYNGGTGTPLRANLGRQSTTRECLRTVSCCSAQLNRATCSWGGKVACAGFDFARAVGDARELLLSLNPNL